MEKNSAIMPSEEALKQAVSLRHVLHRHPALSQKERGTLEILLRFLKSRTSLALQDEETWFYAVKKGTDPSLPAIAFRADVDALPIPETISLPWGAECDGISHKCGHDGHAAALTALAMELDRRELRRTVYLIFQPAEEIGKGGEICAELIREKGFSEVYAFHNLGGYPEGTLVYRRGLTQPASEGLSLHFTGAPSHASAPEEGRNPAEAAARLVLFAGMKAKETAKERGRMVLSTVVGVQVGDGDYGISPGEGELRLTLRAEAEEDLKFLEAEICREAEMQAEENGLMLSVSRSDYFPETRNTDAGLASVLAAAKEAGVPTKEMQTLWRASEDFGYYTKQCDGAIFYIGNGEDYPPLHTTAYDFNDRILETAVRVFLALVEPHTGKDDCT